MPPLLLKPIVAPSFDPYIDGLVGAALFLHIVGTVHETHWRQPDLARTGFVLSVLIVGTLHLVVMGTILTVVGHGYSGVGSFLGRAFVHLWHLLADLLPPGKALWESIALSYW